MGRKVWGICIGASFRVKKTYWNVPKRTLARIVDFGAQSLTIEVAQKGLLIERNRILPVPYPDFCKHFQAARTQFPS